MRRKIYTNFRNLRTFAVYQEGKQIAEVYGETKKEALAKAQFLYGTDDGGLWISEVLD